ncbi:MAG: hypothetical protein HRU28_08050 [Rhizobiales bacterium]|nr:hypothetical protein [Hyphomicrobiales bacterium]
MRNKYKTQMSDLNTMFSFGGTSKFAAQHEVGYENAENTFIKSHSNLHWFAGWTIAWIQGTVFAAAQSIYSTYKRYVSGESVILRDGTRQAGLVGELNYAVSNPTAFKDNSKNVTTITSDHVMFGIDGKDKPGTGRGGSNGIEDALRHSILFGEVSRRNGKVAAFETGIYNENKPGNAGSDTAKMDLYNNAIGINIGNTATSFNQVMSRVEKKLYSKELKIMQPGNWSDREYGA